MAHMQTPLNPVAMSSRFNYQRKSDHLIFEHSTIPAPQVLNTSGKMYQVRHESEGWKRLLSFMMEENVQLKNLVPDILSSSKDKELLAGIEQFQDRFISEDGVIGLLRNDVAKFETLLLKEESETGRYSDLVYQKLEILRNNFQTIETQFGELRSAFFRFLLSKR